MEKRNSIDIKQDLANAYKIFAYLGMDDLTYTHLSARDPNRDVFYIHPLGQLFAEVTRESLLTVSMDGEVLEGVEAQYNQTGYAIHSSIYKARPDVHAIFHLHTLNGVAVSAMQCGLLPISQFSFHFHNRIAYHAYDSLVLDGASQGQGLIKDLDMYKALFLQNHGTLTCGETLQEAFFYAYYLEKACKVQCLALASGQALIYPSPEVCERAALDMRAFEKDLGQRDWQGLLRIIGKCSKRANDY